MIDKPKNEIKKEKLCTVNTNCIFHEYCFPASCLLKNNLISNKNKIIHLLKFAKTKSQEEKFHLLNEYFKKLKPPKISGSQIRKYEKKERFIRLDKMYGLTKKNNSIIKNNKSIPSKLIKINKELCELKIDRPAWDIFTKKINEEITTNFQCRPQSNYFS